MKGDLAFPYPRVRVIPWRLALSLALGFALWGCVVGRVVDPPFQARLLRDTFALAPGEIGEIPVRIVPEYPTPSLLLYVWFTWAESEDCPSEVLQTSCVISGGTYPGLQPFETTFPLAVQGNATPGTYRLALNLGNEGTRRHLPFTLRVVGP